MKELFSTSVLIILLSCASFAFLSSTTGWFDLRHSIERFHLWGQTTVTQAASNSVSEQLPEQKVSEKKPSEKKVSEQKVLEQRTVEPTVPEPKVPEQKAAEQTSPEQKAPEQKPIEVQPPVIREISAAPSSPPAISEAGYDQLRGLGWERRGYGLYSYGILAAPSPRSAAFLSELLRSTPQIGDAATTRTQLNIFYIPTKKDKVADLAALVTASHDSQMKLAARYSESMYDYKTARAILSHLCNPPANPMKSLCKGPMSGGPYILTDARPVSSLEPVPPPFLFIDLSDVNPQAYPEFISTFRISVKQEDVTDDAKLYSLRLKVLNLSLGAADWGPKAKRSIADIVHVFDSSPDGQASR